MKSNIRQWVRQNMPLLILLIIGIALTIASKQSLALVLHSVQEKTLLGDTAISIAILSESLTNFGLCLILLTMLLLSVSLLLLEKRDTETLKSQKNEA